MRVTFHLLVTLTLAALVFSTGCKRNKGGMTGSDLGAETEVIPEGIEQNGIPLTGAPFDSTHQALTDVTIAPVYFGYDSFQLAPEEVSKVEQAADELNRNANYVLIVEGHCDERGSNEYNLSLGEQRALAIRTYLVNLGISADRIQSRSFGEERPAATGSDESAWRQNRRGEFAFYK